MELHQAAAASDYFQVRSLLEREGIDINAIDESGNTPLHIATEKDDYLTIMELLERGADVNARDNEGRTPLHLAVIKKSLPVIGLLLKHGADINMQVRKSASVTALHWAAYSNESEITQLLCAYDADPHAQNVWGWTPLHYAAAKGHLDTAKILLQNGACQDMKDDYGQTPLQMATLAYKDQGNTLPESPNRFEMMLLLLKKYFREGGDEQC